MPQPPSKTSSLPDEALAAQIRAGDERALAEVYDRHATVVFSLARSIVAVDHDAEEITEAVFLHLWSAPERFDPGRGTLKAYLSMLGRSRSLDLVRARRRRRAAVERSAAADSEAFAAPVSSPGPDPEAEVLRRERREHLGSLLRTLTADQREVIELAYFDGLTQREIAEALGAPLGTIKTRIRDGMSKLREAAMQEGWAR